MITKDGYSKDPNIIPEGVVITFGREMINNNGGPKTFITYFLNAINSDNDYWMHKMTNRPTIEFADVYIICFNRLWGKVKFGWYENHATFGYSATDKKEIKWPRMAIVGPFEHCPFKRTLKGFQGFRYCTKLF